ncbi:MAG TPA: hypothetical protein VLT88_16690 [Desulfosarcina sp.]|nr:hypothetical protein [Desulfosarcina sp.]
MAVKIDLLGMALAAVGRENRCGEARNALSGVKVATGTADKPYAP